MRKYLSIVIVLSWGLAFGQWNEEIHYQSYKWKAASSWEPTNDSLTLSYKPYGTPYLPTTIRISLTTGEWVTLGKPGAHNKTFFSDLHEIPNQNLVSLSGSRYLTVLNRQLDTLLTNKAVPFENIYTTDSTYFGTVWGSLGNNDTAKYSYDGIHWYPSNFNTPFPIFSSQFQDNLGKRLLLLANGLAVSNNGGKDFTIISPTLNFPVPFDSIYDFVLTGSNGIYLHTTTGGYLTTDMGLTWQSDQVPNNISKIISLTGHNLLAFPESDSGYFYISNDSGESWTTSFKSPEYTPIDDAFLYGDTIFLLDHQKLLWRSKNNGNNFERFTYPSIYDIVHNQLDGHQHSWQHINAHKNVVAMVANNGLIGISKDKGNHFDFRQDSISNWYSVQIIREHDVFALTNQGEIYYTFNFGESWHQSVLPSGSHIQTSSLSLLHTDTVGLKILAESNNGPIISLDSGKTFQFFSNNSLSGEFTLSPSGKIFGATFFGHMIKFQEINSAGKITTIDSVQSFYTGKKVPLNLKMISDLYGWFFYQNRSTGHIVVLFTKDGWKSHQRVHRSKFISSYPQNIPKLIRAYSPTEMFIKTGQDGPLFHSSDTGKTWLLLDTLPLVSPHSNLEMQDVDIRSTTQWWMVTDNRLVLRNDPAYWQEPLRNDYGLSQKNWSSLEIKTVFPNPTKSIVELPAHTYGCVKVVGINGRRVASIEVINKQIDLSNLNPGHYLLLFESEGILSTARVIVE